MKSLNCKKVKGYIEGYYGKLLSWNDRYEILDTLHKNKMNFYFYCPKEDLNHRLNWREPYDKKWLDNFYKFILYAKQKKIKIIAGLSPGLNFDFQSYSKGNKTDLIFLTKKLKTFLKKSVDHVAILFDDIPNDFNLKVQNKEEGKIHSDIVNNSINILKKSIFTVPRIYSDELVIENKKYLDVFLNNINKNAYIFYTGKYIVSKSFSSKHKAINQKVSDNKIIYWDNFYANDYCPKRLFVGPWTNKKLIDKSMINGTGMIQTDKLLIEIVNKTASNKNQFLKWKNILLDNKVPKEFFKICSPFLSPDLSFQKKIKNFKYSNITYKSLDHLLWKWKSALAREWYPFLLNFKHDLQFLDKKLEFIRVLKTQTNPMQKILQERRNLK